MRACPVRSILIILVVVLTSSPVIANPEDASRWLSVATERLWERDVEALRGAVMRAVEADPQGITTLRRAVALLDAAGVDDEALELARLADERLAALNVTGSLGLQAEALAVDVLRGRAIEADVTQLLASGPEAACALTAVIETLAVRPEPAPVLALTRRVIDASPQCLSAWEAGIAAARAAGSWADVTLLSRSAAQHLPDHVGAFGLHEARALREQGRLDEALVRLVAVVGTDPQSPALEDLAVMYGARRADPQNRALLDSRCDADSNDVVACLLAGAVALAQGDHAACAGRMAQVEPALPERALVLVDAALCAYGVGDQAAARRAIDAAVQVAPRDPHVLMARARVRHPTDPAGARADLQAAVELAAKGAGSAGPFGRVAPARIQRDLDLLSAGGLPEGWRAAPAPASPSGATEVGDRGPGADAPRTDVPAAAATDSATAPLPWWAFGLLAAFAVAVAVVAGLRRRAH